MENPVNQAKAGFNVKNPPHYKIPDTRHNAVTHPEHYTMYSMETMNAIKGQSTPDEFRGFLKGNIFKYVARYRFKNGCEDLEKASYYLDRLKEYEKMHGMEK